MLRIRAALTLRQPLVFIGDGNLGLWAAQGEVYPQARRQRCWNHRLLNLKDKLPKRLQATASSQIYEVYQAPTRQECESRRGALADWLRTENQPAAAETLRRDWDDFVTLQPGTNRIMASPGAAQGVVP